MPRISHHPINQICPCHLLADLKKMLKEKKFWSNYKVLAETDTYFLIESFISIILTSSKNVSITVLFWVVIMLKNKVKFKKKIFIGLSRLLLLFDLWFISQHLTSSHLEIFTLHRIWDNIFWLSFKSTLDLEATIGRLIGAMPYEHFDVVL